MSQNIWPEKEAEVIQGSVVIAVANRRRQPPPGKCACTGECVEITATSPEAVRSSVEPRVAGMWAYASIALYNEPRLVALQQNYGSAMASWDRAKACFGDRVANVMWFEGRQMIVEAPCLTCSLYGSAC